MVFWKWGAEINGSKHGIVLKLGGKMMSEIQNFKVGDIVFLNADYGLASGKIIDIIGLTALVQTEMPVRVEYDPDIIKWRWWYPFSHLTKECPEQHSPDGEDHKKESEKVKIFRIGQVVWFVNVHPTGKYCGVSRGAVVGCNTDGQYIVKVPHQSTVYFPDLIFDNEEDAQNKWDSLKKHLNQKRTNPLGDKRRFKVGDRVVCDVFGELVHGRIKEYDEVVHGRIKEYVKEGNSYIVILDQAVKTDNERYIHAERLSPEVDEQNRKNFSINIAPEVKCKSIEKGCRRFCDRCSINALCTEAYKQKLPYGYGCDWTSVSSYNSFVDLTLNAKFSITILLSRDEWNLLDKSTLPGQSCQDVIHAAIVDYCTSHTSIVKIKT